MSVGIKRLIGAISRGDKKLVEQKLRQLLNGFDALHESTLAQLDRTDAALDRALAHFARPQA